MKRMARMLSPRLHLSIIGVLHAVMGFILSSPTIGMDYFSHWAALYGIAAVLCWLAAWKWRNRWFRTLSLMAVMSAAVSRGVVFYSLTSNEGGLVVYFMLAYLEYLLWPHILPPHIVPADLLSDAQRYQVHVEDLTTGEMIWPPHEDD